jgi:ubiquitin C-terminal hydrolase
VCEELLQATKQLKIYEPPLNLMLHLKRFSVGGEQRDS